MCYLQYETTIINFLYQMRPNNIIFTSPIRKRAILISLFLSLGLVLFTNVFVPKTNHKKSLNLGTELTRTKAGPKLTKMVNRYALCLMTFTSMSTYVVTSVQSEKETPV